MSVIGAPLSLGGVSFDLLWTNPSPSSSFAAQTVSVDLSDYSYFIVDCLFYTGDQDLFIPWSFFPVDEKKHYLQISNDTVNRTGGRTASYNDANKKISFAAAHYNGATNNGYIIPFRIYGIKI